MKFLKLITGILLYSSVSFSQTQYAYNCKVDRLFDDRIFGEKLSVGSEVSLRNNGRSLIATFGTQTFYTPANRINKIKETDSIVSYKIYPRANYNYNFFVNIHSGQRPLGGEIAIEGESSWDSRVIAFIVCP